MLDRQHTKQSQFGHGAGKVCLKESSLSLFMPVLQQFSLQEKRPKPLTQEVTCLSAIRLSYQLKPELKFPEAEKTEANRNEPRFLASSQSTSQHACIFQAPPPGPANMSVVSGVKGETAQQARSLVGFSWDTLLFLLVRAHPPLGDTEIIAGKRWNLAEEYHMGLC